jgi:hypothetical protein
MFFKIKNKDQNKTKIDERTGTGVDLHLALRMKPNKDCPL